MPVLEPETERLINASAEASRHRGLYLAAWRGLRGRRNEIAEKLSNGWEVLRQRGLCLRPETADLIYREIRKNPDRQLAEALRDEASAAKALAAHTASAGLFSSISPKYVLAHRTLTQTFSACSDRAAEVKSSTKIHLETLKRVAQIRASDNRKANERDARPLAPLVKRLADLDRALQAVEAGDESCVACLLRDDIERLVDVARLWSKMEAGEKLGDVEYARYHDARYEVTRAPPRPGIDPMDFLRAMASVARPGGPVYNGQWEEMPQGGPPPRPAARFAALTDDDNVRDR
jgi:hypothetical protein